MDIKTLISLSEYAKANPELIPNHSPDIPNKIKKEIDECTEILGYVSNDDLVFAERLRGEIKDLHAALKVYI